MSLTHLFCLFVCKFFIAEKENFLTKINATDSRANSSAAKIENNPRLRKSIEAYMGLTV